MLAHNRSMRTNVNLAEDSHQFASSYADARGISLSTALSELVRKARAVETTESHPPVFERSSAGVPLFPDNGRRITVEMVRKAEDESLE